MSTKRVRVLFLSAALAYTAFVIYGSLVPLDFHSRSWADAFSAFLDVRYLQLGMASRADWVANILLFIPLAFLWLATVWPQRRFTQFLASALVGLSCVSLSIVIEFTQIFFPPRTVSLNDLLAESIGTAVGLVLWWTVGPRVVTWLQGWSLAHGAPAVSEQLLYGYLFLLIGYNILPLDLTLSPAELFHKWREGRLLLIPFSAAYQSTAQMLYDVASDIAIWIPVGFLWSRSARATARRIFCYVIVCAAALELLQLFVYSRTSDTTDVMTAAAGGWLGIAIARGIARTPIPLDRVAVSTGVGWHVIAWLFATLIWLCALTIVFWYPFDFRTDWGFVQQRLANLRRVPFEAYYWGSEFKAVTELLHKTGFFFPLGSLFAIGVVHLRHKFAIPAGFLHVASVGLVASVAAMIEAGQLFLPNKNAD
ncbi:MAG: VanZ family protein, partial [Betaproteobacteria bacterium]|nr:VanZ family protein [Betaproteobacteria bacterium]